LDLQGWVARLGLNYKVTEHVSVNASGYRAFRGPTLNELFGGSTSEM
jgi:outer membrane receptor protein involved in Fe transport